MNGQVAKWLAQASSLCLCWLAPFVFAAPTAELIRKEIDTLLARLDRPGCEFNRNGAWYPSAEAKKHLLKKLEYFEGKTTIASTESFIELAASKSSSSGKPYQVKCGTEAAVESQIWLSRELVQIRSKTKT